MILRGTRSRWISRASRSVAVELLQTNLFAMVLTARSDSRQESINRKAQSEVKRERRRVHQAVISNPARDFYLFGEYSKKQGTTARRLAHRHDRGRLTLSR